jgi:diadenosine tetraphosphate (Ap4A) HIT family hydrolase
MPEEDPQVHPGGYCDNSGLCEEIEEVGESDRVVRSGSVAVLLVDISPMTLGHCLVATRRHVPRTAVLTWEDYRELQSFVAESRVAVEAALGGDSLLVEHGAADGYSLWDCVCHGHVHVVPMHEANVTPLVAEVIPRYMSDVAVFDAEDHAAVHDHLSTLSEYLSLTVGRKLWIGAPRPGIRHGSRYLIADLCALGEERVDWGVVPRGTLFRESLESLTLGRHSYV